MQSSPPRHFRSGRSTLGVLVYLISFGVLLFFVSRYYLLPAYDAAHTADPAQRKMLSASAMLIMAVVLMVLLVGLLLTFRIGRFFRPRQSTRAKPTKYVDAWEESGRRMKTPEAEE